jgi:hypothetical protein
MGKPEAGRKTAYRPQVRFAVFPNLSILGIWHTVRTANRNKCSSNFRIADYRGIGVFHGYGAMEHDRAHTVAGT